MIFKHLFVFQLDFPHNKVTTGTIIFEFTFNNLLSDYILFHRKICIVQVKRIGHSLPQYFLLKRKFAAYSTEAMLLIFLSCKIKLICLLEKHFLCQSIIEATWNVICIVLDNIEFEGSSKQQYSTCFNCFHSIPIKWDIMCYIVSHTWHIVKVKSRMMNTTFLIV